MSGFFDGYADHYNENVRLILLKALHDQTDGRLNDSLLEVALEAFGVNKSREYLHTQLRWLQDEAQAVILKNIGTAVVAEITEKGENHILRKSLIVGIQNPTRRTG